MTRDKASHASVLGTVEKREHKLCSLGKEGLMEEVIMSCALQTCLYQEKNKNLIEGSSKIKDLPLDT